MIMSAMTKNSDDLMGQREPNLPKSRDLSKTAQQIGFTVEELRELDRLYGRMDAENEN